MIVVGWVQHESCWLGAEYNMRVVGWKLNKLKNAPLL